MRELIEDGLVKLVIDWIYKLVEIVEVYVYSEMGYVVGKIVIINEEISLVE